MATPPRPVCTREQFCPSRHFCHLGHLGKMLCSNSAVDVKEQQRIAPQLLTSHLGGETHSDCLGQGQRRLFLLHKLGHSARLM